MHDTNKYFVGIDGGGSKCSAMLFDDHGKMLGQGIGGAANASRDYASTLLSIVESVQQALYDARLSQSLLSKLHVSAGLAGACVPNVNAQLKAWKHPFANFRVTSDLMTACYGAHGGGDGAILIIGTGSAAAKMQNNTLTQFGGHGFLLGDKGSGAWFGRAAVSSTLEALDTLIPMTQLHRMVLEQLDVCDTAQLVQRMIGASTNEFAALAPGVILLARQGDANALALVREGVRYLDALCSRTLHNTALSLVLMGGLASSIEPWFSPALREKITLPLAGPEWGAMHLLQDPELTQY